MLMLSNSVTGSFGQAYLEICHSKLYEERGSTRKFGSRKSLTNQGRVSQDDTRDLTELDWKHFSEFVCQVLQGQVGSLRVEKGEVADDGETPGPWRHFWFWFIGTFVGEISYQENGEQNQQLTQHFCSLKYYTCYY